MKVTTTQNSELIEVMQLTTEELQNMEIKEMIENFKTMLRHGATLTLSFNVFGTEVKTTLSK